MKSKIIFIILFAIFGFTISCTSFETPKIMSVDDVQITREDSESLFIDSKINVYNPNSFSISTKDISFNLYIDSVYIGKGDNINKLVLGKKTNSNINSSLIIKKSKLKTFLNLKDSITLKILGSTNIFNIPKKFYFDFDYRIYPKDFITLFTEHFMDDVNIQIKNVKVKKLNYKNIFLELTFALENKSTMECNVKSLDIKLFKSNSYQEIIGRSEIKENFRVRSNSINQFESQLKANILSIGSALFSNTIGNRNLFFVEVNSIIEYNNMEFPFTIKKKIDYNPRTLEIKLK